MLHLVIGIALAGLGVWGVVAWWGLFGLVMRGVVPFFLLVFGLIAILASFRRLAGKVAEAKAMQFEMDSAEMHARDEARSVGSAVPVRESA